MSGFRKAALAASMAGGTSLLAFMGSWVTAAPAAGRGPAAAATPPRPAAAAARSAARAATPAPRPVSTRPRVLVTTDGEQDDLASMHRFIMYVNDFDVAGIVETSSRFHHAGDADSVPPISQVTWLGSEWVHAIIRNYAVAYPRLKEHDPNYPTPESLTEVVKVGNISDVHEMAKNTEGSEWIKKVLLDDDPRPLYISVWGGTNAVAAALRSIRDEYYGKPQWNQIYQKVSKKAWLLIDLDQDSTYKEYIAKTWPDVNIVMNNRQFGAFAYGWYNAVPAELRSYYQAAFQERMIRKGPIQADYSLTGSGRGGGAAGPQPRDWFTEGDSPLFMIHFTVGLSDMTNFDPTYGNWGGRYLKRGPRLWVDNPPYLGFTGAPASDYSPYVGYNDWPTTTLAQAVAAGSNRVRLASVANLTPRDVITVGTGATAQQREILSVGTAAAPATKLAAPAAAGATIVRLENANGIGVGDPITIGAGANQETRTVIRAGKGATATTLSSDLPAGATRARLGATANLSVGDSLTVGSGAAAQTLRVATVGKPSSEFNVARAVTTLSAGSTTLAEATVPGSRELRIAAVGNFYKGQTVSIDTGAAQETVTLEAVGVGGGTTLGLPATAGGRTVKILSTANFLAGTPVWIGSGANLERATISLYGPRIPARGADQEGTRAAGASTLSAPSAIGSRFVKVAATNGFLVGAPITIGSGEDAEYVNVAYVGTAGPEGTGIEIVQPLKRAHAASTPISASGLTFVEPITKNYPAGTPISAAGATVSAALTRPHAAQATVSTITPAGTRVIKVASVAGFEAGRTINIGSAANRETAVIASVGTAGLGGTGITLTAPTRLAQAGPVAVEQVTAQAGATRIKLANIPPPAAPVTAPAAPAAGRAGGQPAAPAAPGAAAPVAPGAPGAAAAAAGRAGAAAPAGGGGGGGGRGGGAPPVPFALPALSVGDRITIGEGADAETVTVTSIGTGAITGTGISFTPALRRDHDGVVRFRGEGSGVTFATPVTAAFRAGDPVTSLGSGVVLSQGLTRAHDAGAPAQGLGSGVVLNAPLGAAASAGDTFRNNMNSYYPQTRWTAAIQNDFASRVDWQIKSYAEANHPPVVSVGANTVSARPGTSVQLRGSATDPDRNTLKYTWWQYREPGTYPGVVSITGADTGNAQIVIPQDAKPGQTIHLILEVQDSGTPPITRYQRVVVTVAGAPPRQAAATTAPAG